MDPITGATNVYVGFERACALMPGRRLLCWGNSFLTGSGNSMGDSAPRYVRDVSQGVAALALALYESFALTSEGRLWQWGAGTTPEPFTAITDAVAIAASPSAFCAVVRDGTLRCRGADTSQVLVDPGLDLW